MFCKQEKTYMIINDAIDKLLSDPTQALGQNAKLLPDNATHQMI